ncbi:ABC transporter ATP-binding protein [Desulfobacterales bacterium HSG16]|nr:ABC transporter ATP-binding protein [Desulfobacterales bacterium HSG16]
MLRLENLDCGYGKIRAVHSLDMYVKQGEISAILGANGAGKTSVIMCIAGHVKVCKGQVIYKEKDITTISPVQRVKKGIAIVPEGRRLFSGLTVKENLIAGGYVRPEEKTDINMGKVFSLFPRLQERLSQYAGSLSGGEQQMLAIGRALMAEPELLLVDELSLGLMPKMIDICYDALNALKNEGLTIVLVEQSTHRALEVANHAYVLESGNVVWKGPAENARDNTEMIDAFLGMGKS